MHKHDLHMNTLYICKRISFHMSDIYPIVFVILDMFTAVLKPKINNRCQLPLFLRDMGSSGVWASGASPRGRCTSCASSMLGNSRRIAE